MRRTIGVWTFALLAVTAPLGTLLAATYQCQNSTCPHRSTCDGDRYERIGCKIQCFYDGADGLIIEAGSATCGEVPN